jgi:hypothetical protein
MIRPGDWGLAGLLFLFAWWAPLPLYLVALSCFALPHVIWEAVWIRRAAAGWLPRWWWGLLAAVLAIQAGGRLAVLTNRIDGEVARGVDLVTLALAVALVLAVPGLRDARRGWLAGLLAMVAAVLLAAAGVAGSPDPAMAALVALSVAHNFVPIGLERLAADDDEPWGCLRLLLLLPLVLLVAPTLPEPAFAAGLPIWWAPPEPGWLRDRLPAGGLNLFPALVLAQCLHYVAILRVLPRRLEPGWGRGGRWFGWRVPALTAAGAMTLGFAVAFPDARRLYGVAAGVHAWIEWPILLCLLAGVSGDTRGIARARFE